MGKLLDFFERSAKKKSSLLVQEATIESHLEVMLLWLHHEDTAAIVKSINGAKQLFERLESNRNTVVARMRTLRIAIKAYEEGYEHIVTSKNSRDVVFIAESHPNARAVMQNQIHLIDAVEKNLVFTVNMLLALITESARKTKKKQYLQHVAVMREAVNKFS